jgi:hypothetical protein
MIARTLFMTMALFSIVQANAKDMALQGAGATTCAVFANLYKLDSERTENLYFTWTQGYLSGWSAAQMDAKKPYVNLAKLDVKAQEALLRRYCDQHPLGNYLDAVFNLID